MSILQQAIRLKCNKVVYPCMRRQIHLKCFDKTNINHKKQTGSSCIMFLPLKQHKIVHYMYYIGV